jgi:hypothetical protein
MVILACGATRSLDITMRHLIIVAILMLSALRTEAAPPREMLTLEDRVTLGCRHANLVFVGRVVNLRAAPRTGGEMQTADLKLVELIKGASSAVPRTLTNFKSVPRPTDTFSVDLEDKRAYLIIMDAPGAPGLEFRIPEFGYDGQSNKNTDAEFNKAVLVARRACRQ